MLLESAVGQLVKIISLIGDVAFVDSGSRWSSVLQPVLQIEQLSSKSQNKLW